MEKLILGDCIETLRSIPDGSVDLVLTDPPYNIGVTTIKNGKKEKNAWDQIEGYLPWCMEWLKELERVLKPTGVMYLWHNQILTIAELLRMIQEETSFSLRSFCVWDKGEGYRASSWKNRKADGATAPRSFFPICEYCLHFFKGADRGTGLEKIYSSPENFKTIKAWYKKELERLGVTEKQIAAKYTEVTGKKPHMLCHYFKNSQFAIPTERIYKSVYEPLGFEYRGGCKGLRQEYEGLRQEYKGLRQEYKGLRHTHHCDAEHCNIWHEPMVPTSGRLHTCQKPIKILRRLIRVSSNPGEMVLDCFMGSGSTGVAALLEGRDFIGIEKDPGYYTKAQEWIEQTRADIEQRALSRGI